MSRGDLAPSDWADYDYSAGGYDDQPSISELCCPRHGFDADCACYGAPGTTYYPPQETP